MTMKKTFKAKPNAFQSKRAPVNTDLRDYLSNKQKHRSEEHPSVDKWGAN